MGEVVSIIIPTYNTETALLIRAVASAVSQEHVLEIIVVDDGSDEFFSSSMHVIEDHYKPLVEIKHIKKAGVSAARNHGLNCARGDYIVFLDSDDMLSDGFIASALNHIERNGADAVFGVGVRVYPESADRPVAFGNKDLGSNVLMLEGEKIEVLKSSLFNGDAMRRVCLEPAKYVSNCGAIYRRSLIKSIRYREEITISEDRIFNYDVFDRATRIALVGEIYYYYSCNSASTSQRLRRKALDELVTTSLAFEEYAGQASSILKNDIYNGIIECFMQTMWFTIVHKKFHRETGISRRCFVRSVCEAPVYQRAFKHADPKSLKLRFLRFLFQHRLYAGMTMSFVLNSGFDRLKRRG